MYKKNDLSKKLMVKTIKFSPDEIKNIETNAKIKGLSFSSYVREAALSGIMSEDYYEKKYLTGLVSITDGINKLQRILSSSEPNITEIKSIVTAMDKESFKLWQY